MLTGFRPEPNDQVEMLQKNESALRKSDESAWTILPSQISSSMYTGGSTQSIENVEFVYRRLSCEDDLFTARVYKRNFFTFRQREASKPGRRTSVNTVEKSSSNDFHKNPSSCHQNEAVDGLDSAKNWSGPKDGPSDYGASSILRFYQRPLSSRESSSGLEGNPSISNDWPSSSSNHFAVATLNQEPDTWHLDLAVQQGQIEILDSLLKNNGIKFKKWIRQQILQPALCANRPLVDCLIRHDGGLLEIAYLEMISAEGHFETLETLVKKDERASVETDEQIPRNDSHKSLARHNTWSKIDTWKQMKMILACYEGNTNLVQCLLRSGATIEEIHLDLAKPLESNKILHLLLSNDQSRFSEWKSNSLMQACVAPNQELMTCLLENNVSLDHEDLKELIDCGRQPTILDILRSQSHNEWVCEWKSKLGLVQACREGKEQLVNFFLDEGVSVKSRELPSGDLGGEKTALHLAACHGHMNIVTILLNHGADVNQFDSTLRRPLHDAALNGATEMIAVLLENGALVNTRDETSYQPLHLASRSGSCEAVRLLLVAGAYVDCVSNDGFQPLHHAAQFCDSKGLATLLLDYGANIEATTNFGYTPLELACESGHILIVKELLSLGAQLRNPYRCHYPGESITNPLGLAVINRHLNITKELLSQGADPSICNPATGASAIHILAACYRAGVASTASCLSTTANFIQLLLEWGADIGSRDHQGRQVFHYLAKYPAHREPKIHALAMKEVAVVLKRAGADIDVRDLSGASPLDDAVVSLESWVVEILLDHGASRIGRKVFKSLVQNTKPNAKNWQTEPDHEERVRILNLLKKYKAVV